MKNDTGEFKIEVDSKIEKSKSETIRWIIGWVQGLLIAPTGFLFSYLK